MVDSVLPSDVSEDGWKELVFTVPWGIIAAKAWGDPCSQPVLLIHGIQDNAGTFDRLIPYLPPSHYYVGIDLPGHGRSSRLPNGIPIDNMLHVLSVNRVVCQLKWDRFTIIGHSLGGQITILYTSVFPDKVEKFIILDSAGPYSVETENYTSHIRQIHEKMLEIEDKVSKTDPPSYSYEEALSRVMSNRNGYISKEAAEKLLVRSLKRGKNGYYFSTDQRLKLSVPLYQTFEQVEYYLSKIRCPSLAIVTETLNKFIRLDVKKMRRTRGKLAISTPAHYYKTLKQNPNFKIEVVQGSHDVHNVSPEVVAPFMVKFLLYKKSSL